MKNWLRWNVANDPITEQDVVAVAAVGILLGGTIVWFVFAAFWGYQVFEDAGSAADWAAAIATGLIGVAALRISVTSHNHQIRQANEARSRVFNTSRRRLAHAKLQGLTLKTISTRAEDFQNVQDAKVSQFRFFIERTDGCAQPLAFSEETLCEFPADAIEKLSRLNIAIEILKLAVATGFSFLEIYGSENDNNQIDDQDMRLVQRVVDDGKVVEERYNELMASLTAVLDGIIAQE